MNQSNPTILCESNFKTVNDGVFFTSCKIIAFILNELAVDKSTKGYLRDSIRMASVKAAGKKDYGKHMAKLISKDALAVEKRGPKPRELILEHSIPVKVIVSTVCKLPKPTTYLEVADVIFNMSALAVITKQEDSIISSLKLGSTMPEDWDGNDKLIRYKLAGIELVENPF